MSEILILFLLIGNISNLVMNVILKRRIDKLEALDTCDGSGVVDWTYESGLGAMPTKYCKGCHKCRSKSEVE